MRALTVAIPATSFPKCAGGIGLLEGRDVPGLPLGRLVFLAEDSPGVDCRSQVVTARRNGLRALGVGESRGLFELRLCGLRLYEEHERLG